MDATVKTSRIRTSAPRLGYFPWTVTFRQNKGDAVHAYYRGWAPIFLGSSEGVVSLLICGAAISCVLAIIASNHYHINGAQKATSFGSSTANAIVGVTVFTCIPLSIPATLYLISPFLPMNVARRRRPLAKPLTVGIDSQGVAVNNGSTTVGYYWNDVWKIATDRHLIYLATRRELILIPRSAFLDMAQADEFLAAARAYRRGETPLKSEAAAPWPPPAIF